uniref:REST corepressor 3 n=1 Tax=Eptatretus burgeri TaxID=7764 RepID=A0A8C4QQW1_EPTBU
MPSVMDKGGELLRCGRAGGGTKSFTGGDANGHLSEESSSSDEERGDRRRRRGCHNVKAQPTEIYHMVKGSGPTFHQRKVFFSGLHKQNATVLEYLAGGGMRVGLDYQAIVSEYHPNTVVKEHPAMLVWSPYHDLPECKLDEYVAIAKEKHGYNMEQALGMLFWHKHNIEKALADLPNFTPFPDEWTVEDKVLFEQAFSFHGKSFHRIQQMLPDKSIGSLVRYYYSWKKTRTRISVMDRQARRLAGKREHGDSDDDSEEGNEHDGNDSDFDPSQEGVKEDQHRTHHHQQRHQQQQQHFSMHGSTAGPMKRESQVSQYRHHPLKSKRRPPRGMYLNRDDLLVISANPSAAGTLLRQQDMELISLKRQVQNAKQLNSTMKQKMEVGISQFRPGEVNPRISARWSTEEQLLAVQGVRKYGKDFRAIADVIGTKSVAQIKNFFISYRRRFSLDEVLQEWESEQGVTGITTRHHRDDGTKSSSNSSSAKNSDDDDEVQPVMMPDPAPPPPVSVSLNPPPPLLRPPLPSGPSLHHQPPPLQPQHPRFIHGGPPTQPPPLIRPTPNPPRLNPRPLLASHPPSLLQGDFRKLNELPQSPQLFFSSPTSH